MIKINLHVDVIGEKMRNLLDFVIQRSDAISVSRYYDGFMDLQEFTDMQKAYYDHILKEDNERRDKYRNNIENYQERLKCLLNHIKSDSEAYDYFQDVLEQELIHCNDIKYNEYSSKPDRRFVSSAKEFIKSEYTRITPVTRNPVFELCYFGIGKISDSILNNMKELYDYPYIINGVEFEDLTFYNNGNVVCAICSHEEFAYLILEQHGYDLFRLLDIKHQSN